MSEIEQKNYAENSLFCKIKVFNDYKITYFISD